MQMFRTLILAGLASVAASSYAAESAKVLADVEVTIDDAKLVTKSAGIRTLYITLYDDASPGPMPYGALKVTLTSDPKGTVHKGKLDTSNVMIMGGGEAPKKLRIKARLDKDGSAGPDGAGDLTGIASGVVVGSKVTIKIDKAI